MSTLRRAFALLAPAAAAAAPTSRAPAPDVPEVVFEKHVLPNGLELVLHVDRELPIVHVNQWFHVGSGNEEAGRTGFAHLFEHTMFQGSGRPGGAGPRESSSARSSPTSRARARSRPRSWRCPAGAGCADSRRLRGVRPDRRPGCTPVGTRKCPTPSLQREADVTAGLTLEQVRAAAAHARPGDALVVVVGDGAKVEPQLAQLGLPIVHLDAEGAVVQDRTAVR